MFPDEPTKLQSALGQGGRFLHSDHLGTPRQITRPSDNQTVWKWDNSDAFGANAANDNPSGLGIFAYNLRFPGQYADAETNTNYNYKRDYDPSSGRYVQSDPIGLKGGPNTYAYVSENPLRWIDPFGLYEMSRCEDCPNLDSLNNGIAARCKNIDNTITNIAMARCLKERCKSGRVTCRKKCPDAEMRGYFDTNRPGDGANICTAKDSPLWKQPDPSATVIHEWCHSCEKETGYTGAPGTKTFGCPNTYLN